MGNKMGISGGFPQVNLGIMCIYTLNINIVRGISQENIIIRRSLI